MGISYKGLMYNVTQQYQKPLLSLFLGHITEIFLFILLVYTI